MEEIETKLGDTLPKIDILKVLSIKRVNLSRTDEARILSLIDTFGLVKIKPQVLTPDERIKGILEEEQAVTYPSQLTGSVEKGRVKLTLGLAGVNFTPYATITASTQRPLEEVLQNEFEVKEALIRKINPTLAEKYGFVLLRDEREQEMISGQPKRVPWFHCRLFR